MKKHNRSIIYAKIFLCIFIGSLIYYVMFPEVYFVEFIDNLFGKHYFKTRIEYNNTLIEYIRNYLMDFLWSCSLTSTVGLIIGLDERNLKVSAIISICFIVFTETIQLFNFVPGVFDICDILVELSGIVISLCIDK